MVQCQQVQRLMEGACVKRAVGAERCKNYIAPSRLSPQPCNHGDGSQNKEAQQAFRVQNLATAKNVSDGKNCAAVLRENCRRDARNHRQYDL
jgi:hypothetical protein